MWQMLSLSFFILKRKLRCRDIGTLAEGLAASKVWSRIPNQSESSRAQSPSHTARRPRGIRELPCKMVPSLCSHLQYR